MKNTLAWITFTVLLTAGLYGCRFLMMVTRN